jgi:zinc protease
MRGWFCWVAVLCCLLPASVRAEITSYTLPNGLQLVIIPRPAYPFVAHSIFYRFGAADEPPGASGGAHMLEHMMFKSTKHRKAGEVSRLILRAGGSENGRTTQDFTYYEQLISKDQLELVMDYEADRMRHLILTQKELDEERRVVLSERRASIAGSLSADVDEQLASGLYAPHPYSDPVIGYEQDIENLKLADLIDMYQTHYRPDNAIVVVTGDVNPSTVWKLAVRIYGRLKSGDRLYEAEARKKLTGNNKQILSILDRGQVTPSLHRAYRVASFSTRGAKEKPYALSVLAEILGGSKTSRLYRELVVKQRLLNDVGVNYRGNAKDMGQINIWMELAPKIALPAVQRALDRELKKLAQRGPTPEEFAAARRVLHNYLLFEENEPYEHALNVGRSLAVGRTLDDVARKGERLDAVSAKQVLAAARYVLQSASVTIGAENQ